MNTILWIGQILLAIIFLYSGKDKAHLSEQQLIAKGQTGVVGKSAALIHFIGIAELLGVIGIIFPWLTGIAHWLTPVSAAGFALVMMLAAPIHYRLKEYKNVAINISIMILSLFVAWGRARQLL